MSWPFVFRGLKYFHSYKNCCHKNFAKGVGFHMHLFLKIHPYGLKWHSTNHWIHWLSHSSYHKSLNLKHCKSHILKIFNPLKPESRQCKSLKQWFQDVIHFDPMHFIFVGKQKTILFHSSIIKCHGLWKTTLKKHNKLNLCIMGCSTEMNWISSITYMFEQKHLTIRNDAMSLNSVSR